jgi:dolichyl-phosphate beta-glucosyltransferase
MDISIIIPALNEEAKIARDIEAASVFMNENGLKGEIIVVDDGSLDQTTAKASSVKVTGSVRLKVIRNDHRMGKGYSVRRGILESSGIYVMFADAGLVVPFKCALTGLGLIKSGACEIAHGSRKTEGTVIARKSSFRRRLSSLVFNLITRLLLGLPSWMRDTQCGFKVYKGDVARKVYAEAKCDGFAFDLEIIVLAIKNGIKTCEFPD